MPKTGGKRYCIARSIRMPVLITDPGPGRDRADVHPHWYVKDKQTGSTIDTPNGHKGEAVELSKRLNNGRRKANV